MLRCQGNAAPSLLGLELPQGSASPMQQLWGSTSRRHSPWSLGRILQPVWDLKAKVWDSLVGLVQPPAVLPSAVGHSNRDKAGFRLLLFTTKIHCGV